MTWRVRMARMLRRWAQRLDEQPTIDTTLTGGWVVNFKDGTIYPR